MISIVLPCFNEMRHGYLPCILDNLARQTGDFEVIAAVTPSEDGTQSAIAPYENIRYLEVAATNRAQRLNAGIAASRGDIVLLHHPATLLPAGHAVALIEQALADSTVAWGGFRHQFDLDHWLLRFTSWYSTEGRGRRGILYLDHCIFARRQVLEKIGGVPDMDIFEDTALSLRLRQFSRPQIVNAKIVTSARRFRDRGVVKHAILNQVLKLYYHLGMNPQHLNRLYEQKSQINVRYK